MNKKRLFLLINLLSRLLWLVLSVIFLFFSAYILVFEDDLIFAIHLFQTSLLMSIAYYSVFDLKEK